MPWKWAWVLDRRSTDSPFSLSFPRRRRREREDGSLAGVLFNGIASGLFVRALVHFFSMGKQ